LRYRPIGVSGGIISAVSLGLSADPARSRPGDWVELIYAALENGINGFDVAYPDAPLVEGLAQAFAGFDRKLAFVAWRLGGRAGAADFSARGLMEQVKAALAGARLSYLDAVMLDDPPAGEPARDAMGALNQLKSGGLVRHLGVAGEGEAIDGHIESGGFDLLQTPFNLTSGWRERNRLRSAGATNMSVIGYRSYPSELRGSAQAKSRPGGHPLAGAGTYAFLEATSGWRPEEICLAYALTEPALASVLVRPGSTAELARTAAAVDRDMPPGLAAQIEMARFSPEAEAGAARTLRRA
jgi:aryl-alcohol dehydrogenase-like predicted oxidoreductase